jgi:serine/threonine protein kinase
MVEWVGQTVGQYQIVAQLGQGGMATVYKAYHARLDRYVAVKVVHQLFMQDQSFTARFEREAQIVARLDHPHIVPVYDFNEHNGQPYLVMKFVEGRTLKALENEHPLSLEEILRLLPPVAAALDYAHGQGVLHRDIKPSNILIDANNAPYLTDFGLARMAKSGESTLSHDILLGTPNYISPEQAQGKSELTPRTDHYSLGIVLYELLVGRVPFSADTPFAVVHSHIYTPPPAPSSINPAISPAVDAVLMKALAKNPEDRYPSAAAMVEAFRSAVASSDMHSLNLARQEMQRASGFIPGVTPAREDQPTLQTPPPEVIPSPQPDATPSAAKRVVEVAFDFGNLGDSIRQAGEKVRSGIERVAESGAVQVDLSSGSGKQPAARSQTGEQRKPKNDAGKTNKSGELEDSLREAGKVVMEAIEGAFSSSDPDIAPENDEAAARRRIEKQLKERNEFFGHAGIFVVINLIIWVTYLAMSGGSLPWAGDLPVEATAFPWPFVVSFGWGAGLAAHGVETYFNTGARAARRLRIIRDAYRREFGANWARTASKSELKRVRRRAEQPYKKRVDFFTHAVIFVMINLMFWGIYLFGTDGLMTMIGDGDVSEWMEFPWPLIVTFGWGIGLISNFFEAVGAGRHERAIEQALERERSMMGSDKPKRALAAPDDEQEYDEPRRPVRLTADGELTDSIVMEIEDDDDAQRTRRR